MADFASSESGKCRINPEMSMYTWAVFVVHMYLYLADMLGTGNTAKSYEYEDSTNFSKTNNLWTGRSNGSSFPHYLFCNKTGMLWLIVDSACS